MSKIQILFLISVLTQTNNDALDVHTQRSSPSYEQSKNYEQNDVGPLNLCTKHLASNISDVENLVDMPIDLTTMDAISPISFDSDFSATRPTFPLNLTKDSTMNVIENVTNNMRSNDLAQCKWRLKLSCQLFTCNSSNFCLILAPTESNCNNDTRAVSFSASVSSDEQFDNNKENDENHLSTQPQAGSPLQQVPPTGRNYALNCQVHMHEEDVNRLIQSGRIFINQERFHYKHKPAI